MKASKAAEAIGFIDDDLIASAESILPVRRKRMAVFSAVAAVIAASLVVCCVFIVLPLFSSSSTPPRMISGEVIGISGNGYDISYVVRVTSVQRSRGKAPSFEEGELVTVWNHKGEILSCVPEGGPFVRDPVRAAVIGDRIMVEYFRFERTGDGGVIYADQVWILVNGD